MCLKDARGLTNTVNPDQEQSDLDLQCLSWSVCPKTKDSSQYDETNMRASVRLIIFIIAGCLETI